MTHIKVYKYGLLPPASNGSIVRDQMRAAHRYRNTLVEIERGRRAAERLIVSESGGVHEAEVAAAAAEAELAEALGDVLKTRAKTRSRSESVEQKARLASAREARRIARNALREARHLLKNDAAVNTARAAIQERAAELRRSARAYCGVYWGTYLLIEDADQASRKMPLYEGTEPNDPRFSRWQGEGHVGVQLQGGLDAEAVFTGSDTRIQIAPVDERAWLAESRGDRRRASRTTLRLRVGSDDERGPVWAEWPMILHRALPPGAVLKRAVVSLRMVGPREQWSVELTVDEGTAVHPRPRSANGMVAIDLGWRAVGEELRVATWASDTGDQGEVVLDAKLLSSLRYGDSLRGVRDDGFALARARLARWLAAPEADVQLPAWLTEATQTLSDWRSPARLAALARRWRDARFPGDEAAYLELETWRYKDFHLWEWESSQRTKSHRHRREVYRIATARLAARFDCLVLEKFDLTQIARRPEPADAGKPANETARSHRQLAAVSDLRLALVNAFGAASTLYVNAVDSTRTCHVCGVIEAFDAQKYLHHACSGCGTIWDQDENACQVLLVRAREQRREQEKAAAARADEKVDNVAQIPESRWAKAKRMGREKRASAPSTRNAVDDDAE